MKTLKALAGLLSIVLVAGLAVLTLRLNDHPSLAPYQDRLLPAADAKAGELRVTWLGVSTLLFDDGQTGILIDGFFSRPGKLKTLLGKVGPDRRLVDASLARLGVTNLAAVVVVHSHWDHVLDAPYVAEKTGALLVGSRTTRNIGIGYGLDPGRIHVASPKDQLNIGGFGISLLHTIHSPNPIAPGELLEPLTPPAHVSAFKEGGSYSVVIAHRGRRILVQASAGFVPDALDGVQADVVFLGIGMLGKLDQRYRENFWKEVVQATGAQRVIPIHWDDFWLPLDTPLKPLPSQFDDFPATMRFLLEQGGKAAVEVRMPEAWISFDPFAPKKGH